MPTNINDNRFGLLINHTMGRSEDPLRIDQSTATKHGSGNLSRISNAYRLTHNSQQYRSILLRNSHSRNGGFKTLQGSRKNSGLMVINYNPNTPVILANFYHCRKISYSVSLDQTDLSRHAFAFQWLFSLTTSSKLPHHIL